MIEKLEILDKEGWVLKGADALIQFKINELVDKVNFLESCDKQVEINQHQTAGKRRQWPKKTLKK